jgi:hypothetical protein
VPTSSIFGPILFLLYINDLPMNIKDTKTVLFADDTNILLSIENGQILQQIINRAMTELHSWFYANSLLLNTEKTTAMSLHARQERDLAKLQIKFGNTDIAYKSETKFLGIHISEYMKGDAHVRPLSPRFSKFG